MALTKNNFECQECKHIFKLPKSTFTLYKKSNNLKIFCERCLSDNIGVINK